MLDVEDIGEREETQSWEIVVGKLGEAADMDFPVARIAEDKMHMSSRSMSHHMAFVAERRREVPPAALISKYEDSRIQIHLQS